MKERRKSWKFWKFVKMSFCVTIHNFYEEMIFSETIYRSPMQRKQSSANPVEMFFLVVIEYKCQSPFYIIIRVTWLFPINCKSKWEDKLYDERGGFRNIWLYISE